MRIWNVSSFILSVICLVLVDFWSFSLIPACVFFVLGVVDTARCVRLKTPRQKYLVSVYLFVATLASWLVIDLVFYKKGPGVIIFIFYILTQIGTGLRYLFRPYVWIPIAAGMVASALIY